MSNGIGPADGTLTIPGYGPRGSDLVLRVVSEGWGCYAGFTVVHPETGEMAIIDVDESIAVGHFESPDEDSRYVAIPRSALRSVDWTPQAAEDEPIPF